MKRESEAILAFRKKHRISQETLARRLSDGGIHKLTGRQVRYWEAGVKSPSPYIWRALRDLEAEILGNRTAFSDADENPCS